MPVFISLARRAKKLADTTTQGGTPCSMTRSLRWSTSTNQTKMPGDPAYADLDEATKSALLDLAIGSPEAHQAAATVIRLH